MDERGRATLEGYSEGDDHKVQDALKLKQSELVELPVQDSMGVQPTKNLEATLKTESTACKPDDLTDVKCEEPDDDADDEECPVNQGQIRSSTMNQGKIRSLQGINRVSVNQEDRSSTALSGGSFTAGNKETLSDDTLVVTVKKPLGDGCIKPKLPPKEMEKAIRAHTRNGHNDTLPAECGTCWECQQAFAINKGARKKGGDDSEKEGIVNLDTFELLKVDSEGNRYTLNGVVIDSRLGLCSGEPRKDSATTAKTWAKQKAWLESKTDPGGKLGYKVTEVQHDPGSEFMGAFQEEVLAAQLVRTVGEVDRHTDNAIVERLNQSLQRSGTAMILTAAGLHANEVGDQMSSTVLEWANILRSFNPITARQHALGTHPWFDQFGEMDIMKAMGVPIHTFGELAFLYIKQKDRHGKLVPRAIVGVWAGVNLENLRSHKVAPFKLVEGQWVIGKCLHGAKVNVITGVFPLRDKQTPAGQYLGLGGKDIVEPIDTEPWFLERNIATDAEAVSSEGKGKEYEVEAIIDSVYHAAPVDQYEYRVKWVGYDLSYALWIMENKLKDCGAHIADYWAHNPHARLAQGASSNLMVSTHQSNEPDNACIRSDCPCTGKADPTYPHCCRTCMCNGDTLQEGLPWRSESIQHILLTNRARLYYGDSRA